VEINIGESTHHHDQFIVPRSFNVIKTIVNKPVKPIPLLDVDILLIIFLSFWKQGRESNPQSLGYEPKLNTNSPCVILILCCRWSLVIFHTSNRQGCHNCVFDCSHINRLIIPYTLQMALATPPTTQYFSIYS